MYCAKCGNPMPDGSNFCKHCGAKANGGQASQPFTQPPHQAQWNSSGASRPMYNPAAQPVKSNSSSLILIGSIVIAAIAGIFFLFLLFGGSDMDYIASIKAISPIRNSDATYAELVDCYFENAKWQERRGEKGIVYVDISGKSKDRDKDIKLTIRVEPTDDPEIFTYTPHRIMIDGQGSTDDDVAGEFVYDLYLYYQYGWNISFNLFT